MNNLSHDLVVYHILQRAPQLGLTCKEYYELIPKIEPDEKHNIKFPSTKNNNPVYIKNGELKFEYEACIDFQKLDEMIEDNCVRTLNISTKSQIFIEIKRIFEIILKNPESVMNSWKYRSTFIHVNESHYDNNKCRKPTFVQLDWMNSFVLSLIMSLYH